MGVAGRTGDGLVAVVHQGDEFADLLGDLVGLGGRSWLVDAGIAKEKVWIRRIWQALMGGHGPKDVLPQL